MTRSETEKRIAASAENLLAAARKEIMRMIRSGASLLEILQSLSAFRLPPAEAAKFRTILAEEIGTMKNADRIIVSRAGAGSLQTASAEAVKAAYEIVTPQIKSGIKNYLVRETQRAMASGSGVSGLKRNLAARSGAAEAQLQTLSNSMVAQYNNLLTFNQARTSGTTRFLYSGPVAANTRPFCMAHAGLIFTTDEISRMDNGQGLPVSNSCGGYNCRHEWVAVPENISNADAGGRAIGEKNETLTIGKMSFVVDAESKATLFGHYRTLAVDVKKYDHTAEWYSVAKPLARAHDGLNERITNSPADGVWMSRMRVDKATGEIMSNFEQHIRKHGNEFGTRDDYRSAMAEIISSNDTVCYRDRTALILHNPKTDDILMLNYAGQIETFYKWDKKRRPDVLKDKKSLDSIQSYL